MGAFAFLIILTCQPQVVAAEDPRDNVVILLDASGSMKGGLQGTTDTRMSAAKKALKAVLQKVPPSTHIGLLVFSASNLKDDWAYPLGPRDDARLFAAIDSIQPGHDTPLGRYIKKAADRLLQERAKEFGYGSYRLLVVTDGEAQDQPLVEAYTPEVIARGLTVDVIGVAMAKTHTLATKVHSYRRANDPAALSQALSEIFAEVRSSGQDAAAAEAFSLIAPLPDQLASAMIQALVNMPNHPIGERPKRAAASPPARPEATPAAAAPAGRPVQQASPSKAEKKSGGVSKGAMIVMIVVLLIVFRRAFRRSR